MKPLYIFPYLLKYHTIQGNIIGLDRGFQAAIDGNQEHKPAMMKLEPMTDQ
jgi:hypothetical protein